MYKDGNTHCCVFQRHFLFDGVIQPGHVIVYERQAYQGVSDRIMFLF